MTGNRCDHVAAGVDHVSVMSANTGYKIFRVTFLQSSTPSVSGILIILVYEVSVYVAVVAVPATHYNLIFLPPL